MSKVVSYSGEKWSGTVTFSDPLTLEQEAAFELGMASYRETVKQGGGLSAQILAILKGVLPCVEKWNLGGFPEVPTLENWPTRPKTECAKLSAWLLEQMAKLYQESTEAPNA
jgi:hypothetical protein